MQEEVRYRDRPEQVVLEGIVGSTAYGMATADSDLDRIGVFMEPVRTLLSLSGLRAEQESWKAPKEEEGDRTLHELGKFCRLVLAGNPTYTELLWLPDDLYLRRSLVGLDLIAMREQFLSAQASRSAYLEYATQQFRKLERRGDGTFSSDTRNRTAKHGRHMARLLYQGYRLWTTGGVVIRLPPEQVRLCRDIGEQVGQGRLDGARQLLAHYEHLYDTTPTVLPERPDREAVDRWLISVRLRQRDLP